MDPLSDAAFPLRLPPGGSYYLMKEKAPLLQAFKDVGLGDDIEIRAVVHDAINRPFYSDWQKVDLTKSAEPRRI